MKKLVALLSAILLVSALVIIGCAAPATAPKPAPVPAPATAPAPAPAPSPAAPAAPSPTAVAAPAIQKPIELKFAHHSPPTSYTTLTWINPYAKQIEEATKGRLKITMYPARTLVSETQALTAVQYGVADMAWIAAGVYPGRFPLLFAITLPFLCLNTGKVNGVTYESAKINSRILEEAFEATPELQAEWSDFKVLYVLTSDPTFLITTKKPVSTQSDLKGMKVRTKAGGEADAFKALGATPVNLQVPDIYEAAQRGTIDGALSAWSQVTGYRFYEVFKHFTVPGFILDAHAIVMNKDKWNGFTPDIQQQIMSVSGVKGAELYADKNWGAEAEKVSFDTMKKAGYEMKRNNVSPEELQKWKEICGKPLWDAWIKSVASKGLAGQKVLDALLGLQEKYKP